MIANMSPASFAGHAKPVLWPVLAALVAGYAALPAFAADLGKAAPDVALRSADGTVQQLSALRGKTVYLDFWASWCIPCRQSFPWMGELQRKYAERDLVVIAINLDTKNADAEVFLGKYPATFRLAFDADGTSAKSFGVKAMPTSFVIGRDGTMRYEHRGFRESQTEVVETEIRRALEK